MAGISTSQGMNIEQLAKVWRDAAVYTNAHSHGCNLDICVGIDHLDLYLTIRLGKVIEVEEGPLHMRHSDLRFWATSDAWQQFWSPVPPPGFHDLFAMSSYGHIQIHGVNDVLLSQLRFIKDLLSLPRQSTRQITAPRLIVK